MNSELTEEEMRRALFGTPQSEEQMSAPVVEEPVEEVVLAKSKVAPAAKKKTAKAFTPRLKVTLRVGNEFEGKMVELIHEADTLSSLLAEQEAVKAARKKYKYVEVVSVKSM
jgi:phosphate-selective porin